MNVQVLIATMNQNDFSLLDKMNIQTDAIVGNQCAKNEILEFDYNGRTVKWLSANEKGVGLNRNNTLLRSNGDIILFADDDVIYNDGYEKAILDYYDSNPKADVVIFNFLVKRGDSDCYERVTRSGRVNRLNATKYGTYCITAKRKKIFHKNITFHLDFGGGAKYTNGEDTIFLQECLKKKLKVYSTKTMLGIVEHRSSTWFNGYNDKYFFDKGVLFSFVFPKMCKAFALIHCLKHRSRYKEYGVLNAYEQMKKGIFFEKRNLK